MNRPTNHERLFDDALADETPAGFRDALLGETLRHARRRRRWRQARGGAGILATLCLVAVLARPLMRHQPVRPPAIGGGTSFELVHTQPLPAGVLVTTEPLSPERLVVSTATVNQIQTGDVVVEYREINDDELLALAAPRPAVLVRIGPHAAKLIFVNPADQNDSPLN